MKIRINSKYWYYKRLTNEIKEKNDEEQILKYKRPKL